MCASAFARSLIAMLTSLFAQVDDQELADELAELEQEELNKRLAGAEAAPLHSPAAAVPAGACCRPKRHDVPSLTGPDAHSQDAGTKDRGGRGGSRVAGVAGTARHVIRRRRLARGHHLVRATTSLLFACRLRLDPEVPGPSPYTSHPPLHAFAFRPAIPTALPCDVSPCLAVFVPSTRLRSVVPYRHFQIFDVTAASTSTFAGWLPRCSSTCAPSRPSLRPSSDRLSDRTLRGLYVHRCSAASSSLLLPPR